MIFLGKLINYKITAISLAVILVFGAVYSVFAPIKAGDREVVEVTIENGQSIYGIASKLKENKLIRSENVFVAYVYLTVADKNLKAGKYILSRSLSLHNLTSVLAQGLSEPEDIAVVVPEGFNIWEIDRRFFEAGLIKQGQLAKEYQYKEGHLFPDTYRFEKEVSLQDIVSKMENNFFDKGTSKSDEIIIIASLLEKEARTKEDMKIVAGIIKKRLELKMPLQIDASVAYGWCLKQVAKPNLSEFCDVTQAPIAVELKIDGPYNIYIRKGLPVGPISNPGLKAIEAALHPVETDYLYYLSPRGTNDIVFSKTPAEHAANRRKYLGL